MEFIANEISKNLIIENLIKNGKIELNEAEVITKIANQVVNNVFGEIIENLQMQYQAQQPQQPQQPQVINENTDIVKKLNKII